MLSWRMARHTSGAAVAAAVTLALLVPVPAQADGTVVSGGAPGETAAPSAAPGPVAPVDVKTTKVPEVKKSRSVKPTPQASPDGVSPEAPSDAAGDVVAELDPTTTSPFRMIGVTWSPDQAPTNIKVDVRTRTDGQWSDWTALEVDTDASDGQPGTEPLWVGTADGVATRVSSDAGTPQDIEITTIDPGAADDADATEASWSGEAPGVAQAQQVAAADDGSPTYSAKPTIISRKSWGAASGTKCDTPIAGDRTRGVVVHHTAGSNSYSKSDSKSIVRSTQAYHMKARKWCDLGYNFLVDKYGQIFEGRAGGVDRAVRAAHSGNLAVNTYTMGVSMMGNYEVAKLSGALKDSMVKLIGWRMGTNYLPAKGTYKLGGKTLNMIAGHRNVISTACPGKYGYAWLGEKGGLRDRVEKYLKNYSTPVKKLYSSLGASKAGAIYVGEDKWSTGSRLRAKSMDLLSVGASGKARTVGGAFRTEYDRLGSRTGSLGYPTSNATAVTGGTRQTFQAGRIYLVKGKSKAYSLNKPIADLYASIGGSGGKLGVPTSSTTVKSGVSKVTFAKGYITVSGGRATAYQSNGTIVSGTPQVTPPAKVTGVKVVPTRNSVAISWAKTSGATTYDVCLKTAGTSTTCVKSLKGLKTTSTQITGLAPTGGRDYYVQVRALKGSTAGAWTSMLGFDLTTGTPAPAPAPSSANVVNVPSSGKITVKGHGFGHGIGMSQYGAQGAAKQGVKYSKILSTYYPGTKLATKTGNIRVLISQDTTDPVDIVGKSGLFFRKTGASSRMTLPTSVSGKTVTRWRIVPRSSDKTQSSLQYRTNGDWKTYKSTSWTGEAQFEGPPTMSLIMPDGSAVAYRGMIRSAPTSKGSKTRATVNVVSIEQYVQGVIAAEMPASWASEALKAQSVAARTYGVRSIVPSRYYDICNTTACQVYGGLSRETAATNAATAATKGKILTYAGKPAFTQFSSSSGGFTALGSQPYLKSVADPYDNWSGNPNRSWSTSVTAKSIQNAYPSIGTLKQLRVTKRTGGGAMGGRVVSLNLVGSSKTVTITGPDARWAMGLKSHWFGF